MISAIPPRSEPITGIPCAYASKIVLGSGSCQSDGTTKISMFAKNFSGFTNPRHLIFGQEERSLVTSLASFDPATNSCSGLSPSFNYRTKKDDSFLWLKSSNETQTKMCFTGPP